MPPNVEPCGSTAKTRVTRLHFENDPVASSILYTMRDPKKGISCGKKRKMEVNEVKDQLANAEHLVEIPFMACSSNKIEGASISSDDSTLTQVTDDDDAAKLPKTSIRSKRYKEVMETLRKPVCSYSLIYGHHLAQTSKTPRKRGLPKKTPTKTRPEELRSFPKNVKCLLGTGMLDGTPVKYRSASRENELQGMIKGSSYVCGCKSCNYSKEVNADEFENHADCKTCHPNNHIHLENGKTVHHIVQELKNTPRSMLCDAIQSVLGTSLNQEAFSSWKESFGAQECSFQDEI